MLSLSLLGRPMLVASGQPVALTIRKTWALLVLLALDGAVARPRIVAVLWPGLDESTARRNLRRELARLRDAGAAALVQADGDFLALDSGTQVDLQAFEQAVAGGQHAQALALWRGPLADGLSTSDTPAFDDWLAAERERLRGRWRVAQAAAAVAAEAQGDADTAIVHLQALLTDNPLHERHHAAVIRLYATAGRRDAALEQFDRCRALLHDELGLEPLAETSSLVEALRRVLPAAPPPAASPTSAAGDGASPAALLPAELPFVGRAAEVTALEAAWRDGQAVLIEGEGGVGKSRLALQFAAAHGACALARCRPGDAEVPYASFTRALRALAGPTSAVEGLPAWVAAEVARLLPEAGAPPPPVRSDEERSRFFEACAQAWLALATDNFDSVILDDWHHADAASTALLGFVARRRRESAPHSAREWLLLRPEIDADALRHLRDTLGAWHLRLQPLPEAAVFELVQRLSGASRPARFAQRLQQATAGNPFFLAETLRHLAEQRLLAAGEDGVWQTPFDEATHDYRELPVPASVREAVLARAQRLTDSCRRVLEVAALAAEPFAPTLLAPACALSELDTVMAIEQAVQAQLLREHEAGGFAFAHDLVQQALDAALSPERRRLVHRRLALGAEASGAPAAVVALHHEASGDLQRAVPYRLAAGAQAQRLHALAEAMAHWQKALADGATPSQALPARQGLMQAARVRCEFEAMLTHGQALQDLAARVVDRPGDLLSADERAGALISVADNLAFGNRAAQALELLDRLPPTLAESVQGQMLVVRARAMQALGRVDEAKAAAQAALALPSLPVDVRLDLLDSQIRAEFAAGELVQARAHADAALALAQAHGDEAGMARARLRTGLAQLVGGDLAAAEAELQAAAAGFGGRGVVYMQRIALYNLSLVYEAQSLHAQALATARLGWDLQPPLPPCDLRVMYRLAFVDASNALGDLGTAWAHAQDVVAEVLAQDEPFTLLAAANCTLELLGLLDEAALAQRLQQATDRDAVRELRLASPELWIVRAQHALADGEVATARQALAAIDDPAQIADVRVRARHGLARAELALGEGDAAAASRLLPADDTPGMNAEMRTRALALRLRAEAAGGSLAPATVQAAQALLEGRSPYAPATLLLHAALAQACQQGVAGAPDDAPERHGRFVATLAGSLLKHPGQQAAFLKRCR